MRTRPASLPALPIAAFTFLIAIAPQAMAASPRPATATARRGDEVRIFDFLRRLDVNRLDLFTSNFGSIGFDLAAGSSGLYYPRGAGTSVLFASGVWVGAQVAGQTRVTVGEYSQEYAPGDGIVARDAPATRTYKMKAFLGDPADLGFLAGDGSGTPPADVVAHDAWSDYVAGAPAMGGPTRVIRLPDFATPDPLDSILVTGPDLPGDLALWSVYNDLDPARHTNDAGHTLPLGIVVTQTVFGFTRQPGEPDHLLQDVAFVRLQIHNSGSNTLESALIGFWADPDVGGAGDDLAAWSNSQAMGYMYGASDFDSQFGNRSPAFGIGFLPGAVDPNTGQPITVHAFGRFFNGTDPASSGQSYDALSGLQTNGQPWIDPFTLQPTRFPFPGDPVSGTGWLDTNPADRRMMISVGPVTLAPGQSVDLLYALAVGQGDTRLESVSRLRCAMDAALVAAGTGFARPFLPPDETCVPLSLAACPLPAQRWAAECATPVLLTATEIEAVANQMVDHARSFAPTIPSPTEKFCAQVAATDQPGARARAEGEFAALQGNAIARSLGLTGPGGNFIGLPLDAPVSCPGLSATTVQELLERCSNSDLTVTYERIDAGARDLQPVDAGLTAYGGAADFGANFFASSLDPVADLDSFPIVDVRFDMTQTQKAYRYLRLEQVDGSAPGLGREYRYGGFREVPFRCIDAATGEVLDVGFAERAVADFDGTLRPAAEQPATFDSTWHPDASPTGGREYLFIFNRGYTGNPRPAFATDGFVFGTAATTPPTLYVIWVRRLEDGDEIEDGEQLIFLPEPEPSPGADRQLVMLARRPQDDPATIQAYADLAACLKPINEGQLSGPDCDKSVPVLATLLESSAGGDGVHLAWFVSGRGSEAFDIERQRSGAAWRVLAHVSADGSGIVRFDDVDVTPGERLSYRLVGMRDGTPVPQGEVTIDVPGAGGGALSLAVVFAPAADLMCSFNLPARGPVQVDVYSLAGRRVGGADFGTVDAGRHTRAIPGSARMPAGVYLVRLHHAGKAAVAKAVFVH